MTEFDLIIEATRRGFLKQIGGALAAAVSPMPVTRAVASTTSPTAYDISAFLTPEKISEIALDMWYDNDNEAAYDGDVEEDTANYTKKVLNQLKTGKPLDTDFLRAILLNGKNDSIYKHATDAFKLANPSLNDDELKTYLRVVDDMRECPGLGDAFTELKAYLPPGDIVANGRVIFSGDDLVETGFFDSLDDVKTNAADYINHIKKWADETAEYNKVEQQAQAKKSIDNTHSQLGIRRDSAWYESVLKEQDCPIV